MLSRVYDTSVSAFRLLLRWYLSLVLRASLGVFDLSFHLIVGFSLSRRNEAIEDASGQRTLRSVRPVYRKAGSDLLSGMVCLPEGPPVGAGEALLSDDYTVVEVDEKGLCLKKKTEEGQQSRKEVLLHPLRWLGTTVGEGTKVPQGRVLLGEVEVLESSLQKACGVNQNRDDGQKEQSGNSQLQILVVSSTPGADPASALLRTTLAVPGIAVLDVDDVDGARAVADAAAAGSLSAELSARLLAWLAARKMLSMSPPSPGGGGGGSRVVLELPAGFETVETEAVDELRRFFPATRRMFFTRAPVESVKKVISARRNSWSSVSSSDEEVAASSTVRILEMLLHDPRDRSKSLMRDEAAAVALVSACDAYCRSLKAASSDRSMAQFSLLSSREDCLGQPVYSTAAFFRVLGAPVESVLDALERRGDDLDEDDGEDCGGGDVERVLEESLERHGLPPLRNLDAIGIRMLLKDSVDNET